MSIRCQILGLIGFSRVVIGYTYEVQFKLSGQKWKAKCKIESLGQTWLDPEFDLETEKKSSLHVKVTEYSSKGFSSLVGSIVCFVDEFCNKQPQTYMLPINNNGTVKLKLGVVWRPPDVKPKSWKPAEKVDFNKTKSVNVLTIKKTQGSEKKQKVLTEDTFKNNNVISNDKNNNINDVNINNNNINNSNININNVNNQNVNNSNSNINNNSNNRNASWRQHSQGSQPPNLPTPDYDDHRPSRPQPDYDDAPAHSGVGTVGTNIKPIVTADMLNEHKNSLVSVGSGGRSNSAGSRTELHRTGSDSSADKAVIVVQETNLPVHPNIQPPTTMVAEQQSNHVVLAETPFSPYKNKSTQKQIASHQKSFPPPVSSRSKPTGTSHGKAPVAAPSKSLSPQNSGARKAPVTSPAKSLSPQSSALRKRPVAAPTKSLSPQNSVAGQSYDLYETPVDSASLSSSQPLLNQMPPETTSAHNNVSPQTSAAKYPISPKTRAPENHASPSNLGNKNHTSLHKQNSPQQTTNDNTDSATLGSFGSTNCKPDYSRVSTLMNDKSSINKILDVCQQMMQVLKKKPKVMEQIKDLSTIIFTVKESLMKLLSTYERRPSLTDSVQSALDLFSFLSPEDGSSTPHENEVVSHTPTHHAKHILRKQWKKCYRVLYHHLCLMLEILRKITLTNNILKEKETCLKKQLLQHMDYVTNILKMASTAEDILLKEVCLRHTKSDTLNNTWEVSSSDDQPLYCTKLSMKDILTKLYHHQQQTQNSLLTDQVCDLAIRKLQDNFTDDDEIISSFQFFDFFKTQKSNSALDFLAGVHKEVSTLNSLQSKDDRIVLTGLQQYDVDLVRPSCVNHVLSLLITGRSSIRRAAENSLAKLYSLPQNQPMLESMFAAALEDDDIFTRAGACTAIGKFKVKGGSGKLRYIVQHDNQTVQQAANNALSYMGSSR